MTIFDRLMVQGYISYRLSEQPAGTLRALPRADAVVCELRSPIQLAFGFPHSEICNPMISGGMNLRMAVKVGAE